MNKKFLIYLLAINSISTAYSATGNKINPNDRLYNNFVKNIEAGKSNKVNYQLIEKILNKRNKELKDLYLQNNYIVKPEYLEWQIFFSAFYHENEKNDNTKENALYHSDPFYGTNGYYDEHGEYIVTGANKSITGKPYQPDQTYKEVDLGVSIPIKGLTREPLNLNPMPPEEINLSPNNLNIVPPQGANVPSINPVEFQPLTPSIEPLVLTSVPSIMVAGAGGGNSDGAFFVQGGSSHSVISQWDLVTADIDINATAFQKFSYTMNNAAGTISLSGQRASPGSSVVPGPYTSAPLPSSLITQSNVSTQGFYRVVGASIVRIGAGVTFRLEGNAASLSSSQHIFHYDAHGEQASTLDWLESNARISSNEKSEMSKYVPNTNTKLVQYLVSEGKMYLNGRDVLAVNQQGHTYSGDSPTSIFANKGEIIGLNDNTAGGHSSMRQVAFAFLETGNSPGREQIFDNTSSGIIELRAPQSIVYNIGSSYEKLNAATIYNSGSIKMYGLNNVGVYTKNAYSGYNPAAGLLNPGKIVFDTPLEVLGDQSIGIDLERPINGLESKINIKLGGDVNSYSGNANSYDPSLVEESTGLYQNLITGGANTQITLNDYRITADSFTKKNYLIRLEEGSLTLGDGNSAANAGKQHLIESDGGNENILLTVIGNSSKLTTDTDIFVNAVNGIRQTGLYAGGFSGIPSKGGGVIDFSGTLNVSGQASKGVVVEETGSSTANGSSITNRGKISISGGSYYDSVSNKTVGTVGVLVNGPYSKFLSTGSGSSLKIDVADKESTGVFTNSGSVEITNGNIKTSNGAFNLYSKGNTGLIKLSNSNLETGEKSLLFFSENNGKFELDNVTAVIKGSANAGNRGTAFYYNGLGGSINSTAIENYVKDILNNTQGGLTLDMETGSRLFVLDNVNVNLSSAVNAIGSLGINFTPTSTDYKTYMLYKSSLGIDQNINLDSDTDAYNDLEISTSTISNNGKQITGSKAGQVAVAQENGLNTSGTPLSRSAVTLTNDNGIIALTGDNSVGLYTSYGEVYNKNNGVIKATGNNSIGIYAVNGSKVESTTGTEITVGTNGVGIFAEGWKNEAAQIFGDGKLDIKNSGSIKSDAGTGAIGIYLNNNSGVSFSDSKLDISGGEINLKNSENAVGVYIKDGTLNDSGSIITVGKNGIALYAKNSDITLNNTVLNLYGDNALGLYIDSSVNFSGNGIINIDGKNVVLFNIISSGSISNNFTINSVAPNSSYSLGNISNGKLEYTGTSNLGVNGTLLAGVNSAIFLNGSTVTGDSDTAAMALNGQYTGGTTFPGMSLNIDGENTGLINLGDSSIGIYAKNGARVSNKGNISVGNTSAGISVSDSGALVINSGEIKIGEKSQGIYLKDSDEITNSILGKIESSGADSIGIFGNNIFNFIINDGEIDLSGDKSIGIYTAGVSAKTITNDSNGIIKIGNSLSQESPGVGIFSQTDNDIIINNGIIETGSNSIGIFAKNAAITNNSAITIKDGGTGIYANGGSINLSGGTITLNGSGAVGVYASDVVNPVNNNSLITISSGTETSNNYGFIFTGSTIPVFTNNNTATMDSNGIFLYSKSGGNIQNNADIIMNGSNNIGYYVEKAGTIINNADIIGNTGTANIGVYGKGIYDNQGHLTAEGYIENNNRILLGDSNLVELEDENNEKYKSGYSVGLYGEGSSILNNTSGIIKVGKDGIGMYAKDAAAVSVNKGDIYGNGDNSIGIFVDNTKIENHGIIDMTGDNVMGIAAVNGAHVLNNGTIKVSGNDVYGIYLSGENTVLKNNGIITINGTGLGIGYTPSVNKGNILDTTGTTQGSTSKQYELPPMPTLVNSGVINIELGNNFNYDGIKVIITIDPSTNTPTTNSSNQIGFGGTIPNKIEISPEFSQGTSADRYVFEDIFRGQTGKGEYISQSLTWDATVDGSDMVLTRKAYTIFTDGLWYEDFGRVLNENYANSTGNRMKIYDKIDYITNETDFRHIMASLAGNIYANINQREDDVARTFENSMTVLKESENNTKENVKINVIAGKGKNKDETDGVAAYDYTTTGILALREVERTYKHTFGYSLGYLHTGFEFKDGNESEEWVDTIQLGLHNKYKVNGWKLVNDLTGRISIHNIDRNIDWPSPNKRSEMNGSYETYSITNDNILGKEFDLGKNASIMPYGALRAMYITRPTFSEKGLEKLEIEGNDAWSVKPRAGIELKGMLPLGKKDVWKLKGTLDFSYEYELADLNKREKGKLIAIEDSYHKLSKPEEEKGKFKTKALIGAEIENKYGAFLTGEYGKGKSDQDDYRIGLSLKAVF